jgi:hypothetical protein
VARTRKTIVISTTERREVRLASRLWELGKSDVFAGITAPEIVKARIRAAILGVHVGQNIGHVAAFVNGKGESVTLAEAFQKTYGEPLVESWETAA